MWRLDDWMIGWLGKQDHLSSTPQPHLLNLFSPAKKTVRQFLEVKITPKSHLENHHKSSTSKITPQQTSPSKKRCFNLRNTKHTTHLWLDFLCGRVPARRQLEIDENAAFHLRFGWTSLLPDFLAETTQVNIEGFFGCWKLQCCRCCSCLYIL